MPQQMSKTAAPETASASAARVVPMSRIKEWLHSARLLLLLPAVACGGAQQCPREAPPNGAERIIAKMKERYLSSRTYEDTGYVAVITFHKSSNERYSLRGKFETRFDRGSGGFQFDYSEQVGASMKGDKGSVWRHPSTTGQSWLRLNEDLTEEHDLAHGLQALAGVSRGASRIVPLLLLSGDLSLESSLHVDGKETLAGVPCIRLTTDTGEVLSIWISETDYSLQKVITRSTLQATPEEIESWLALLPRESEDRRAELVRRKSEPFECETMIEYAPAFNRPVTIRPSE
jgi:hypothetical protein